MTNLTNSVEVQGMGNTTDLTTVMNLYTSSFTEGFMKGFMEILENYNTPLQEFVDVKKEVKTVKPRKPKSTLINEGFDKLKNQLLREKLQGCKKVLFNPKSLVRVRDLKYKSIYDLDSLSKKKWNEFFSKGKVYIDKNVTSSKISQRILFDKSITKFFGKTESLTN
jgi:hypothetical protein